MMQGYEYFEAEDRIRGIATNKIPSVTHPEGKLYLLRRFLALVMDVVFQNIFLIGSYLGVMAILLFTLALIGYPNYVLPDDLGLGEFVSYLFGFSNMLLPRVICEGLSGQTLGKKISGLLVVMQDGRPCTLWGAVIRSLGQMIDNLLWGLVGLSKMRGDPWKRRYGDIWGKTVVLSSSQEKSQSGHRRIPFIAAFCIALLLQGFLASLMLASQILSYY